MRNIDSPLNDGFESAPEHAFGIEGEVLGVAHVFETRVAHDFLFDAVAVCAGLVYDIGKYHRLAGPQLDALRK